MGEGNTAVEAPSFRAGRTSTRVPNVRTLVTSLQCPGSVSIKGLDESTPINDCRLFAEQKEERSSLNCPVRYLVHFHLK